MSVEKPDIIVNIPSTLRLKFPDNQDVKSYFNMYISLKEKLWYTSLKYIQQLEESKKHIFVWYL